MRMSQDGYLRPTFRRKLCSEEHDAISSICPSVAQDCAADGRKVNAFWGPHVSTKIGFSTDPALRNEAASGGALSGFLMFLLDSGNVDAIIQTIADPKNPLANATAISTTREEVLMASGSRYAPSSPLDILPNLRGSKRRYAFVGKPCDVSAVRSLQLLDPEMKDMIPVLVSFFCAGVPSIHAGSEVLRRLQVSGHEVSQFRHRGKGWPGRAIATLTSGKTVGMSYSESWGDVFSKSVQHRCKICADGGGTFADVVFADAWEPDLNGYPTFEDRPGKSLVLSRTKLGHSLIGASQASGHLGLRHYDLDKLATVQPGQVRRKQALLARLLALRILLRPIPQYRGFGLWKLARQGGVIYTFRNFAGMLRRSFKALSLRRKPC